MDLRDDISFTPARLTAPERRIWDRALQEARRYGALAPRTIAFNAVHKYRASQATKKRKRP